MSTFPPAVENLIDHFARLPGIGRKSAARLVFYVLSQPIEKIDDFAGALVGARRSVRSCAVCQNWSEGDVCPLCQDVARDAATVCVVAEPRDVAALERSREYKGQYHVLHGVISPLGQIGPDDIRVKELLTRVGKGGVGEVIMATNPDTEGEATALYIARLLRPLGVAVTRLAYGLPMGSHLEYADEVTLARALAGRRAL
ncbi:MAG: recombination mediator RecR [Oscillospiraceae bacterium]|nr:recombination mediator RecR [Oscillospiraceae bacterium]